jgi:hypothetical protein
MRIPAIKAIKGLTITGSIVIVFPPKDARRADLIRIDQAQHRPFGKTCRGPKMLG